MSSVVQISFLLIVAKIIFFVSVSDGLCQAPNEWVLEKEGQGISIYTREVDKTDVKEFKAITTIEKTMESLEKLIEDVENYPDWQENVTTAKLLKKVNVNESYIYYTTDVPWPIADRDIVVRSKKIIQDNGAVIYTFSCTPDYLKEDDSYIRMKVAKGSWKLIPEEGDRVKVIYQFYGDPAGRIPEWLINIFIVSGPYGTLKNMK